MAVKQSILVKLSSIGISCALLAAPLVTDMPNVYADPIPTATVSGEASIDNGVQGDIDVCFYGANSTFCTRTAQDGHYSIVLPTQYEWGVGPVNYEVDLSGVAGDLHFKCNPLAFTIGPDTNDAHIDLSMQTQQLNISVVDQFNQPVAGMNVDLRQPTGMIPSDNVYQQLDYQSSELVLTPRNYTGWASATNAVTTNVQGVATATVLAHLPVQSVSGLGGMIDASHMKLVKPYPEIVPTPWGSNTQGSPSFSWEPVQDAVRYKVMRASAPNIEMIHTGPYDVFSFEHATVVQNNAATSFTDAPNLPETSYLYYIAAYNAPGDLLATTGFQSPQNTIVDRTAPILGTPMWSANPLTQGASTNVKVDITDPLPAVNVPSSSLAVGEYYIGDTDPGLGNGIAMSIESDDGSQYSLKATLGANLASGIYKVTFRGRDNTGNWSLPGSSMLVVHDTSTTVSVTGKNKKDLTPRLAQGDILPGLTSNSQTDSADYGITVGYKQGTIDPKSDFQFNYATGVNCGKANSSNCHTFSFDAITFDWVIVNGPSNANVKVQGTATVTVDGVATTNPFTLSATDGNLLSPSNNDSLTLKIYATNADPMTAASLYQASGSMPSANSIKIH